MQKIKNFAAFATLCALLCAVFVPVFALPEDYPYVFTADPDPIPLHRPMEPFDITLYLNARDDSAPSVNARVKYTVTGPPQTQLYNKRTEYFGATAGFPIHKDHHGVTPFNGIMGDVPGLYTLHMQLVQAYNEDNVLGEITLEFAVSGEKPSEEYRFLVDEDALPRLQAGEELDLPFTLEAAHDGVASYSAYIEYRIQGPAGNQTETIGYDDGIAVHAAYRENFTLEDLGFPQAGAYEICLRLLEKTQDINVLAEHTLSLTVNEAIPSTTQAATTTTGETEEETSQPAPLTTNETAPSKPETSRLVETREEISSRGSGVSNPTERGSLSGAGAEQLPQTGREDMWLYVLPLAVLLISLHVLIAARKHKGKVS